MTRCCEGKPYALLCAACQAAVKRIVAQEHTSPDGKVYLR